MSTRPGISPIKNVEPLHTGVRVLLALILALLVSACATKAGLKEDVETQPMSYALAPATEGLLAGLAETIESEHGPDRSGFHVLDSSFDGLYWRLALIDSATTSLDIMTYLWYPDASGILMLERAILASLRGVKVRLVVDDLILHGHDQLIANLNAAPNIEFRMFNPWKNRTSIATRGGEMLAQMERLNTRMHDKLMIADGHAAVIGGRNIGDHYFGLHESYNFHDTDLFGIGAIAQQSNAMFDNFWNSEWVVSAEALTTEPNREIAREQRQSIQEFIRDAEQLESFPREPKDWTEELTEYASDLRIGRSKVVYDEASADQIKQTMGASMFNFFNMAEKELLVQNAYIIPSDKAFELLNDLKERGVNVRILTNSLASHDVPAVNSHYEPWRDDFLHAGVDLWEFRSDPAIQQTVVDVAPVSAEFTGLHSKCAVVDRRYSFIGSMNLDPRSLNINTEMGAFIDSPALAEDLAAMIERNMSGENSWNVQFDEAGDIVWVNSEETVSKQPARDGMQRVMNVLMKVGPKEQY
jgi:putative cardiolipin synthase